MWILHSNSGSPQLEYHTRSGPPESLLRKQTWNRRSLRNGDLLRHPSAGLIDHLMHKSGTLVKSCWLTDNSSAGNVINYSVAGDESLNRRKHQSSHTQLASISRPNTIKKSVYTPSIIMPGSFAQRSRQTLRTTFLAAPESLVSAISCFFRNSGSRCGSRDVGSMFCQRFNSSSSKHAPPSKDR